MDAPGRVLIVEDEPLIRGLLEEALQDVDVLTAAAYDHAEACEALDRYGSAVRVLITDINLGAGPDGFEVAREARRRVPVIFVIYVTGQAGAEIEDEGVARAMVVSKPYKVIELAEKVAELVKVVGTY